MQQIPSGYDPTLPVTSSAEPTLLETLDRLKNCGIKLSAAANRVHQYLLDEKTLRGELPEALERLAVIEEERLEAERAQREADELARTVFSSTAPSSPSDALVLGDPEGFTTSTGYDLAGCDLPGGKQFVFTPEQQIHFLSAEHADLYRSQYSGGRLPGLSFDRVPDDLLQALSNSGKFLRQVLSQRNGPGLIPTDVDDVAVNIEAMLRFASDVVECCDAGAVLRQWLDGAEAGAADDPEALHYEAFAACVRARIASLAVVDDTEWSPSDQADGDSVPSWESLTMPIEPDDAELLESVIRSFLLDVHTCIPGRVVRYNAATQSANIQPVIRGHVLDGDGNNVFELLPVIQNVFVRWERAGGYYDHKPLAGDSGVRGSDGLPNGDHGWLIFNESAMARWRATVFTAPESAVTGKERLSGVFPPGDITRHSISYPFFLPGAWPDDRPLPDAPSSGEAVSIVPSGGHLRVSKAGAAGAADFVALATKTHAALQGILDALNHAVPATGAADGGAGLLTSIKSGLASLSADVAATSLKAD
ncbi:MAG: hypothetical protein ABI548_04645 [Polyangiaceae bacterium]